MFFGPEWLFKAIPEKFLSSNIFWGILRGKLNNNIVNFLINSIFCCLFFIVTLETAQEIIERQKKALAAKSIVDAHNEKLRADNGKLQAQVKELSDKVLGIQLQHAEERQKINADIRSLSNANQNLLARLEETEKFFRWNPSASLMRDEYEREQREEARQREAERKRQAQEREQHERQQQEERARQAREQEQQKSQELERQRQERENSPARQWPSPSRGMGMSR